MSKPIVYIASPYTKGDPAINTRFQCSVFDELMDSGLVTPIAPLWSHFQHTLFPRPYEDWIEYDNAIIKTSDACLRLDAKFPRTGYMEKRSNGADNEAQWFLENGRPVFNEIKNLLHWAEYHSEGGEK